ncbi:MAG: ATP-binding protein [Fibromonadaceae bacterium]|jgi:AAA+ ATPase superfamily predicted ATPase|nr:ATP-binding protein [Fibromonadaceae bacterium]
MPQKFFNIAGPCHPSEHYMLDPLRSIGEELMDLIDSKQYFVIHASRQSGKTTLLWELTDKINAEGKYYALYCSLECLQGITAAERSIPSIVRKINSELENQNLPSGFAKDANFENIDGVLHQSFVSYCRSLDKPLVIFFDEADCLSNGTLISFLRQLRNGFVSRARIPFVSSIALVGMRNIRDYKARIRGDSETLGSSSPFNIVTESLSLKNFTKEDVIKLYAQHTQETRQVFEPQAMDYIYEQTQGHPWLVNAVARECVEKICKKDYAIPITSEMAKTAINNMILARGTHFDSLMERLKEQRVRSVIQPLIMGEELSIDKLSDDYLYTRDLGLIRDSTGKTEPANPIYAEVIVRALNWSVQEAIKDGYENYAVPRYMKNDKIDMDYLIKDFQGFWRENSEIWVERYKKNFYQYDEAAPHLVFQAFLQRVINGGGIIVREMALGRKRADLCVVYGGQKYPIEIKILKNAQTIPEGLVQLSAYMESCGVERGWLVVFDRNTGKSWEEKLYVRECDKITVFGC